ncbi:high-affinity Cu transporter CTR3 [Aspergillus melleus]|uniref:high-affinity Cu transporter CTR3 n=1 Tax=Aspergillus melleus TaxID=138277 RepID=UPI001E8ECF89|nr:Copper Transporter integral membrane protein that functions in high affinity copper transport [Aspergillus melleus]KAH8423148.1 Copper Transporter integral membrane protein that functions in high affinity copper transport [Aspergillus melleus]
MNHMDHMSMTMSMASTGTATAPMSTGTSMDMDMDMGGMSHDMGGSCKISMLWNWNTIDACFLSSTWHITSKGMFAGSCIGVILLVMSLEFLRRVGREYDAFIIRRARLRNQYLDSSTSTSTTNVHTGSGSSSKAPDTTTTTNTTNPNKNDNNNIHTPYPKTNRRDEFRPTPIEQTIRALLHMVQFAVAYFVMLLAMYFNGYIIICIFIGAFLGAMVFSWEVIGGNTDR